VSKIFLSWSGHKSRKVAEFLHTWLPSVLQFAEPYFTPEDIEKGKKWNSDISGALDETNFGIICLTRENLEKPWILFEAGALSKNVDRANVCTLLIDVDPTDVTGPLAQFQHTSIDKIEVKKMMKSINSSDSSRTLTDSTFNSVFEMWWPKLLDACEKISSERSAAPSSDLRSDREIIEEILLRVRSIEKSNGTDYEKEILKQKLFGETNEDGNQLHLSEIENIMGSLDSSLDTNGNRLAAGDHVLHKKFGFGRIAQIEDGKISVDFEIGTKRVVGSFLLKCQ